MCLFQPTHPIPFGIPSYDIFGMLELARDSGAHKLVLNTSICAGSGRLAMQLPVVHIYMVYVSNFVEINPICSKLCSLFPWGE